MQGHQTLGAMLHSMRADQLLVGGALGVFAWFFIRYVIMGFYTVDQSERAVITNFGRAERLAGQTGAALAPAERARYAYPHVRVVPPGGPYFRWPWQHVHKVSIATRTVNMAWDPQSPTANRAGTVLEAVTKDTRHRWHYAMKPTSLKSQTCRLTTCARICAS